jgi:hypothetical protein
MRLLPRTPVISPDIARPAQTLRQAARRSALYNRPRVPLPRRGAWRLPDDKENILNLLSRSGPPLALLLLIGCAHTPSAHTPSAQTAAPAAPAAAPSLAPAGGGFAVDMPGTPREAGGANGNHIFASEVNGMAYVVSYADMPPRIVVTPDTMESLLDATRDSIIHNGHAQVLAEQRTTLDGHPARELHLKTKEGYYMQIKLAFLGSRLYQVGAVTASENSSAPEIPRFIGSFRFTAK